MAKSWLPVYLRILIMVSCVRILCSTNRNKKDNYINEYIPKINEIVLYFLAATDALSARCMLPAAQVGLTQSITKFYTQSFLVLIQQFYGILQLVNQEIRREQISLLQKKIMSSEELLIQKLLTSRNQQHQKFFKLKKF